MWFILILIGVVWFFSRGERYRWFYVAAKTYRRDLRYSDHDPELLNFVVPCNHKHGVFQCTEISQDDIKACRLKIFKEKDNESQDTKIAGLMSVRTPKRKRCRQKDGKSHNFTITYQLWDKNNVLKPVCQKFFIAAIAISQRRLHTLGKRIHTGSGFGERRGGDRKTAKHADKLEKVKMFISQLKARESHYSRSKSKRIYLSSEFNETVLWKLYNDNVDQKLHVSYRYFCVIRAYGTLLYNLRVWQKQNKTVADAFSDLVRKNPNKVAIFFEDQAWTFSQLDDFAIQVARYFKSQGFRNGDCIALLLENRPEFPGIWLGLSKIGVVTALLNTNLVRASMLNCLRIVECKAIIFGSNYADVVADIRPDKKHLKLYQFHESNKVRGVLPDAVDLRGELEDVSSDPIIRNYQHSFADPLLYIYTSGTTGLPKAALITNLRYLFASRGAGLFINIVANDIIYDSLPLYHAVGGMMGLGQAMVNGATVVIRKKFSASQYWKDCDKYKCTVAQYIGEMCRYLLSVHGEVPVKHKLRTMFGNGLRPQMWEKFVNTFGIGTMCEFYGATEGISNMINIDGALGSVGFVPRYCRSIYPVTLIKCDMTTGEPIRNKDGFCIESEIDEPGLLVGKINPKQAAFTFKGYSDEKETEKRILKNVLRTGDMYFNSGDVLVADEFGRFYFKDRTGDTYRWKGENVSTCEVEAIISDTAQFKDTVAYGVEIPGAEGKAGMAAIVDVNKTLDIDLVCNGLKQNLPTYAIPVFIRVLESVPITGTFKLVKNEIQAEGYNVDKIKDTIYFYKYKEGKYINLNKELYRQIREAKINI